MSPDEALRQLRQALAALQAADPQGWLLWQCVRAAGYAISLQAPSGEAAHADVVDDGEADCVTGGHDKESCNRVPVGRNQATEPGKCSGNRPEDQRRSAQSGGAGRPWGRRGWRSSRRAPRQRRRTMPRTGSLLALGIGQAPPRQAGIQAHRRRLTVTAEFVQAATRPGGLNLLRRGGLIFVRR